MSIKLFNVKTLSGLNLIPDKPCLGLTEAPVDLGASSFSFVTGKSSFVKMWRKAVWYVLI